MLPGLTEITHAMPSPASIEPVLPGHFEEFDLMENGKVCSVQMEAFHCCTDEPEHAVCDSLETLPSGGEIRFKDVIIT